MQAPHYATNVASVHKDAYYFHSIFIFNLPPIDNYFSRKFCMQLNICYC